MAAPTGSIGNAGQGMTGGGGLGAAARGAGGYVVEQFREFYDELKRLRDAALISGRSMPEPKAKKPFQKPMPLGGAKPPPLPGLSAAPPPLPGEAAPEEEEVADDFDSDLYARQGGLTAEEALRKLQTLLEMQALEAGRRGGDYGVLYYKEAQYVMAALADEIFLSLDWPGRSAWRNDLLETRLFGSYNAGEAFYKRLDALLHSGDRVQAEVAVVYLLALTLGFRGRYAGNRDSGRIADYKRQLYYYIYQKRPDLAEVSHRMVPEAYQHTESMSSARLLPSPTRWIWLFAAAVAAYVVVAHFVYSDVLAPLLAVLERGGH